MLSSGLNPGCDIKISRYILWLGVIIDYMIFWVKINVTVLNRLHIQRSKVMDMYTMCMLLVSWLANGRQRSWRTPDCVPCEAKGGKEPPVEPFWVHRFP